MNIPPQWGHGWENYTWPSGVTRNTSVCVLSITFPNNIKPPILFYYRLTNFYQNHRRYVKSVDIDQLKGKHRSAADIRSGDCDPLDVAPNDGRPYYPCGLIANSMFNDTFGNLTVSNRQGSESSDFYNMTTAGTSWSHEGDLYGKTAYRPDEVVPPPNWQEQYPEDGYNSTELPDLHTWEQFQVWMRTAGLPTFSKLAQRNDNDELKSGTYRLKIFDRTFVALLSMRQIMLTSIRLSSQQVQRQKIHPHLHTHRHGWQEPFPRYCIHCCGRSLHPTRCCFPRHSSHQAEVSRIAICARESRN